VSLRRDLEGGRNSSWIIYVSITGASGKDCELEA
jgi:hypothetical protein